METYLRKMVLAPKRKASTSSEMMALMTPIRLRYASSASASPGAFEKRATVLGGACFIER